MHEDYFPAKKKREILTKISGSAPLKFNKESFIIILFLNKAIKFNKESFIQYVPKDSNI